MKIVFAFLIITILLFSITGCGTGYTRSGGNWYWVTIDEYNGKRKQLIPEADDNSFEVMECEQFAKDKFSVYFEGKKINFVNAGKVQFIGGSESNYFKDDEHAFFRTEVIIHANPETFEVLEFPYSRDHNDIYCGTIPLLLTKEEAATFKVTNEDELMKGMISTMKLSHFIEFNPAYAWIDSLDHQPENVITGEWGTGETAGKHFKGFYKVK